MIINDKSIVLGDELGSIVTSVTHEFIRICSVCTRSIKNFGIG